MNATADEDAGNVLKKQRIIKVYKVTDYGEH